MKGLIATYLLTYGGAVASLIDPFHGLLVYICFAIIRPDTLWHWSVPPGNYSRIIAIALVAGWALNGCGHWQLGRAKVPLVMIVGFWCWAAISSLFCDFPNLAYGFIESKGKIVLPVLVGATLIHSLAQLRILAWTIVLSQGYVAYDLNMSYFAGFNRLQHSGYGQLDNNCMAIGMVAGAGFAFFLGIGEDRWWKKGLAFFGAALMAHAIFFSFSRGGMLATVVLGVVSFLLLPKTPKTVSLYALGVVAALAMAGPEVRDRFRTTFVDPEQRDESAESRVVLWKLCWKIGMQNPIVGIGPDHFPAKAASYGLSAGKEAHTLWLQILAELGVPGVIFLMGYYAMTCLRLVGDSWRNRNRTYDHGLIPCIPRMVCASLVGFAVAAQFVTLEGLELPYYIGLVGLGALKLDLLNSESAHEDGVDDHPEWDENTGYDPIPESVATDHEKADRESIR